MLILLTFAFLAGIVTVLSPCILPVLPAILSSGTMKGRLRPLGIIIGLIISFTFFTLALTAIVHATGLSANFLRYLAIGVLIAFGLIMIFPALSDWFSRVTSSVAGAGLEIQQKSSGSGFKGGLLFGFALGLLWTPCAGPILAAITTLVATQSINLNIILLTLAYSIGAAIPMFLIAYGGSKIIQSSRFLSSHAEGIRRFFGVLMVFTGVAILLHWDMVLQQQITRAIPPILIEDNPLVKEQLDKLRGGATGGFEAKQEIAGQLPSYGKSPEITGIVNWINSPPLSIMQLKGKVVLIDFWTYSCINCLRTLPYIEQWYKDYQKDGLVIIGVHTPEFEFEKDPQNVAEASSRLGVSYPVAQDNDYKTWSAFQNHYWPAHYLIDQEGKIRMIHFGEGGYVETENGIRELLGMAPIKKSEPVSSQRPLTPETYLGYGRAQRYSDELSIARNVQARYDFAKPLVDNSVGLKGNWLIEKERIIAKGDDCEIDLRFIAKNVYLVLSGSSKTQLQVFLDDRKDNEFIVNGDRKYDVVQAPYGWHNLVLKVPQGISAYAFTFGDEPDESTAGRN